MNLFTFMIGGSVLAPYYTLFAALGEANAELPPKEVFEKLRETGIQAEQELLKATDGVNTQRGQLFLLGLASGMAGFCLAKGQRVPSSEYYSAVREACAGLCERELFNLNPREATTVGQRIYLNLGVTGARGEAEAGFPTAERVGYPAFETGLQKGLNLNDAAVHALISIMSVLTDTTVLRRLGKDGLAVMRETGGEILAAGSVFTGQGRDLITRAHHDFSCMRLSPGGAADVLALSIALYLVEHGYPDRKVVMTPSLFEG